jgi:hypothetical protein
LWFGLLITGEPVIKIKYLVTVNVGSKNRIYGVAGPKTAEIHQLLYHVFNGRYDAIIPDPGRAIFFMALFDRKLRSALKKYLLAILRNPLRLFEGIHIQALILQQPFEVIDGKPNLCDGCINLMPYQGKLINSCRLDEYVGRIMGINNRRYNSASNEKTARFSHFECVNEPAVAHDLFRYIENWSMAQGLTKIMGPFGMNYHDPMGFILVEYTRNTAVSALMF